MAKVYEINRILESVAPLSLSCEYIKRYESYDNSGFLVGDAESEVTGILLALDVTAGALEQAKRKNCNLIISHHPVIFTPLSSVTVQKCGLIVELIRSGISVISAHLNLDIASGGVNDALAEAIGVKAESSMFDVLDTGLGRVGKIQPTTLKRLTKHVGEVLGDRTVYACGEENAAVTTVALLAGGGGGDTENIVCAAKKGADVFISSEFKHHVILLAKEMGLSLISASHHAEEKPVLYRLRSILAENGLEAEVYEEENLYI